MSHPLRDKVRNFPEAPGVYLMKDKKGKIVYVGKAKNLRSRVSHYVADAALQQFRIGDLVRAIADIDIIITNTELEALLTERTMIRHHSPKFNVLLRDDKEYPHVRVDFREDWPRLEKVRRRKDDGAQYIGPFGNAGHLNSMLKGIGRVFPLIRCSRHEFRNAKRPCTYYHMKMCLAPCTLPVDRDVYLNMLQDALRILEGRSQDLHKVLRTRMQEASDKQQYELAAQYRDQLQALEILLSPQAVVTTDIGDADVIGLAKSQEIVALQVLMVREGKVIGSDSFRFAATETDDDELLTTFLMQYYDERYLPETIYVPRPFASAELVAQALGSLADGRPPRVHFPQRGTAHELVDMADQNALFHLQEELRNSERQSQSLAILQERLHLSRRPERMECIDVSNLQGTAIVASAVCFVGGRPARDLYRIYSIQDLPDGMQDDFASIREVVRRRLQRGLRENDLPDLLVIDGGKGQLAAALEAQSQFPDTENLPIVSLAKSRAVADVGDHDVVEHSDERVFINLQSEPLPLVVGSPEYRLLTSIRDEAHRFAISHHRRKRAKNAMTSALDDIRGVGPVLRTRLLQEFGGVTGLRQATLDQLQKIPGVSDKLAVSIFAALQRDSD